MRLGELKKFQVLAYMSSCGIAQTIIDQISLMPIADYAICEIEANREHEQLEKFKDLLTQLFQADNVVIHTGDVDLGKIDFDPLHAIVITINDDFAVVYNPENLKYRDTMLGLEDKYKKVSDITATLEVEYTSTEEIEIPTLSPSKKSSARKKKVPV